MSGHYLHYVPTPPSNRRSPVRKDSHPCCAIQTDDWERGLVSDLIRHIGTGCVTFLGMEGGSSWVPDLTTRYGSKYA